MRHDLHRSRINFAHRKARRRGSFDGCESPSRKEVNRCRTTPVRRRQQRLSWNRPRPLDPFSSTASAFNLDPIPLLAFRTHPLLLVVITVHIAVSFNFLRLTWASVNSLSPIQQSSGTRPKRYCASAPLGFFLLSHSNDEISGHIGIGHGHKHYDKDHRHY
jgi:hypothetical protein